MQNPQNQNTFFSEENLKDFLNKTGYEIQSPLHQDSSIRRYYRVVKNEQTAILMESVPDDSPLISRGHKMVDFIKLSDWLNHHGLKAPQVYEIDLQQGFALIEDFGDFSFKKAIRDGHDFKNLYSAAKEVLDHLAAIDDLPDLPLYYESHVHQNRDLIIKHYLPCIIEEQLDVSKDYINVWEQIEKTLPLCPQSFLHIDFHADNLMWLAHEQGLARVGLLDFQGAMKGPTPYDLTNLLEDARTDIPEDFRRDILSGYDPEFRAWYRVLATQFHCRVIGQFIKIAQDTGNKTYLVHIPRLEKNLAEALKDPLLKPLKDFFDDLNLDFCAVTDMNESEIERFISVNAKVKD